MSATCPECTDGYCERCGLLATDPATGSDVDCECRVFQQEIADNPMEETA